VFKPKVYRPPPPKIDSKINFNFTQDEDDEKVEFDPLNCNVTKISASGEVTITFDSLVRPLEFFRQEEYANLTMNETAFNLIRKEVFNVTFESQMYNQSSVNLPILQDWYFESLDEVMLRLRLNFTNPLYVSSDQPDYLSIRFLNTSYLLRLNDSVSLASNYTIKDAKVPPQAASAKEIKAVEQLADSAQASMIFTLVVPFCFMLFMSCSMDRVWGLYNMLQVQSNIPNFRMIALPANAEYILMITKNVSFFNLFQ